MKKIKVDGGTALSIAAVVLGMIASAVNTVANQKAVEKKALEHHGDK